MTSKRYGPVSYGLRDDGRPAGAAARDNTLGKWFFVAFSPLRREPEDAVFETEEEAKTAFEQWMGAAH